MAIWESKGLPSNLASWSSCPIFRKGWGDHFLESLVSACLLYHSWPHREKEHLEKMKDCCPGGTCCSGSLVLPLNKKCALCSLSHKKAIMVISGWALYYLSRSLCCSDTAFIIAFSKCLCQRFIRGTNIYYFSNFLDANDSDKDRTEVMP